MSNGSDLTIVLGNQRRLGDSMQFSIFTFRSKKQMTEVDFGSKVRTLHTEDWFVRSIITGMQSRKCLGEVTNSTRIATTLVESKKKERGHQSPASSLSRQQEGEESSREERFVQMAVKLMALNSRLDTLGEKFELLIDNVREKNELLKALSHQNQITNHVDDYDKTIKGNAKRALLGDEGYSIYRKTLKPKKG